MSINSKSDYRNQVLHNLQRRDDYVNRFKGMIQNYNLVSNALVESIHKFNLQKYSKSSVDSKLVEQLLDVQTANKELNVKLEDYEKMNKQLNEEKLELSERVKVRDFEISELILARNEALDKSVESEILANSLQIQCDELKRANNRLTMEASMHNRLLSNPQTQFLRRPRTSLRDELADALMEENH